MQLLSPVDGVVVALSAVPDAAFAQGLLGQGAALEVDEEAGLIEVVAPADGILAVVADTAHAFGMTLADGIEILVHVGLDTVELNGDGFEALVAPGKWIAAGTPVLRVDAAKVRAAGKRMVTPIVICDPSPVTQVTAETGMRVRAGTDVVLTYHSFF